MADAITQDEAEARGALVEVGSYEVFLDLTGVDTIRSRTEVRFGCREPGAQTFADLDAVAVHRVVLNGESLDPVVVISGGRLHLPPLAARNALTVEADFGYAADGSGLARFSDPADGSVYLLANCFPTYSSRLFCCFDQPDLRADLTLSVAAPAGWDCVASGAVTQRPPGGQAGVWRFSTVPAMKCYELTLAAGPYVTVPVGAGPVPVTVRCRPSLAGAPGLARVADIVRRVVGYYERILGVPCPGGKLDVTFPPELGPTAMQLPGAMFVNETMLDRLGGARSDFAALVLAHEVAHLWFGCLVEGRWWDDLWLAEAMATYLSYLASAEELGQDMVWAEVAMRDKAIAYLADSLPSTEPVSAPVASAADAMSRPFGIVYDKGASVIRQLAALIGDDALRAGMRDYLVTYGGSATTLADLLGCWSRASGRELTGWARQWLQEPGVNTLVPEVAVGSDGTVDSVTIRQLPPPSLVPEAAPGPVRTHRIAIGSYTRDGARLRRRDLTYLELDGELTRVPALTGSAPPDAVVINDGDLTFANIRFDAGSFAALTACAMDVGDPVTEAVCWNAAWDMTRTAGLSAAGFVALAARAVSGGRRVPGITDLLTRAVAAADRYAPAGERSGLRRELAAAALAGARLSGPGSAAQQALAVGFAASADGAEQFGTLRRWLDASLDALPDGVRLDLSLRGTILRTLSAGGLATDADLAAYAATDPVSGGTLAATCRALRPDPACKEAAWQSALDSGQRARLADAHAQGIWAPGQEAILGGFRDRYFAEALPALRHLDVVAGRRRARFLFPATLADPETLAATDAALASTAPADPLRPVLREQRAILAEVQAARHAASKTRAP